MAAAAWSIAGFGVARADVEPLTPDAQHLVVLPNSQVLAFTAHADRYVWYLRYRSTAARPAFNTNVAITRWKKPAEAEASCRSLLKNPPQVQAGGTVYPTHAAGGVSGFKCGGRYQTSPMGSGGQISRFSMASAGVYSVSIVEDGALDSDTRWVNAVLEAIRAVGQQTAPSAGTPAAPGAKASPGVWTAEEEAAAAALAATLAAMGLSGLAALLLRIRAGQPRSQMLADLLRTLKGQFPADPFEAWKKKYTALGWRYAEAGGVASFEPVAGCRDERGWTYDASSKGFVPPNAAPRPPGSADGEVDPASGKVWSEDAREWLSPGDYERERARSESIEAGLAAERQRAASANRAAMQAESAKTAQMAHDIAAQKAAIDESYRLRTQIDSILDRLEARAMASGEYDANRAELIGRMRERAASLALAPNPTASVEELKKLGRLAVEQGRPGFEITYSYRDALVDTVLDAGAMASDMLLTKGAASAGLASYRGTMNALEAGQSVPGAILSGVKAGGLSYVGGQVMAAGMEEVARIPAVSDLIDKAGQIEIRLLPKAAEKAEAAVARLPGAVGKEVDALNESLAGAGPRYDARRVDPFARLDPTEATYGKALQALKTDPQYLTAEARAAADAVRYDLKMRAAEDALARMYKAHPELQGSITGLQNTGSHALKGPSYRGLASDIDFTPMHNGTAEGAAAARLFKDEFAKSVEELSAKAGARITMADAKMHVYANNEGVGAFRSEGGLKVKDMLNQTSGSIEKIEGSTITHRLHGGDPVEIGEGTRWTTGRPGELASGDPATLARLQAQDTRQLQAFRSDCLNKYREELPQMTTSSERFHQAAKLYKLARTMESKTLGGRALGGDDVLFNLAQGSRTMGAAMSAAEQDLAAQRLLDALGRGI